jgi:hypothetical protein
MTGQVMQPKGPYVARAPRPRTAGKANNVCNRHARIVSGRDIRRLDKQAGEGARAK